MCQHMWTCRHVLICADMCWYVPTCADMCQHVASLSAPLMPTNLTLSACWHVSAHMDMPTCADMCRHVLTYRITFGTSDTKHLDLTSKLACVSTCGHADMCWCVPTCANMYHHPRHLWYQQCGPYLHADMCQHMWTCRHVLICADMWWYVPTCDITLGTCDTNHLDLTSKLACVNTCGHADMCWCVPTCADMCRHVPICANM